MGKSDRFKNFLVRPIGMDFIDTEKNVDKIFLALNLINPDCFGHVPKTSALPASLTNPCTK